MPARSLSEGELTERVTGLVVESLAVKQDFATATVECRRCGETLSAEDAATVTLTCYEGHSWEVGGLYCPDHAVDTVGETLAIRAEDQAVLEARLEPTGYYPPKGQFQPDALTLGAVDVLDYSPTADGY